jgi:hypothetical protein
MAKPLYRSKQLMVGQKLILLSAHHRMVLVIGLACDAKERAQGVECDTMRHHTLLLPMPTDGKGFMPKLFFASIW